ncbi:MAG: hypothetical protein PHS02_02115 [Candidatus ainarchaeum sp.]|nr:hypothetical protein [Candidatus ainarchaeum sp.]
MGEQKEIGSHILKFAPREDEVLVNAALKWGKYLVIPLKRPIRSAGWFGRADALLLESTGIVGPTNRPIYAFEGLVDLRSMDKFPKEYFMGFLPHEEAVPRITKILSKLLGDSFSRVQRTEREILDRWRRMLEKTTTDPGSVSPNGIVMEKAKLDGLKAVIVTQPLIVDSRGAPASRERRVVGVYPEPTGMAGIQVIRPLRLTVEQKAQVCKRVGGMAPWATRPPLLVSRV